MICPSFYLLGVPLQYLDFNVRLRWCFYRSVLDLFCHEPFMNIEINCWFLLFGVLSYVFISMLNIERHWHMQVNVLSGIRKVFLCTRTHASCSWKGGSVVALDPSSAIEGVWERFQQQKPNWFPFAWSTGWMVMVCWETSSRGPYERCLLTNLLSSVTCDNL